MTASCGPERRCGDLSMFGPVGPTCRAHDRRTHPAQRRRSSRATAKADRATQDDGAVPSLQPSQCLPHRQSAPRGDARGGIPRVAQGRTVRSQGREGHRDPGPDSVDDGRPRPRTPSRSPLWASARRTCSMSRRPTAHRCPSQPKRLVMDGHPRSSYRRIESNRSHAKPTTSGCQLLMPTPA